MATGVWLIGARGSVATTTMVGAAAVAHGSAPDTGLVSEQQPFAGLGLPSVGELVFGGHDVAQTPLIKRAEALAAAGVVPGYLLGVVQDVLMRTDQRLRPGVDGEDGEPPLSTIDRLRRDLDGFRTAEDLDHVVVVNLSSAEGPVPLRSEHGHLDALRPSLAEGRTVLPPSCLYAWAALASGCTFIDFTPSIATRVPALAELARQHRTAFAGRDGKTGETLLKSVLAPMFAQRSLRVRSWSGTNLLGAGDGATLADPARAAGKLQTKAGLLEEILGYDVEAPLHIDYVADMGDWKTAWDHITFAGFLGTRMRMQFTWEGCDSALAAPLVIDLARFGALAASRGEQGALDGLAFFFKDPTGCREHRLGAQYDRLCAWAHGLPPDGAAQ